MVRCWRPRLSPPLQVYHLRTVVACLRDDKPEICMKLSTKAFNVRRFHRLTFVLFLIDRKRSYSNFVSDEEYLKQFKRIEKHFFEDVIECINSSLSKSLFTRNCPLFYRSNLFYISFCESNSTLSCFYPLYISFGASQYILLQVVFSDLLFIQEFERMTHQLLNAINVEKLRSLFISERMLF